MRRELTLEVPAARAWDVVGRADLLHLWFPGIATCVVEGDIRTITLDTGIPMVEKILTNDSLQRRFQYTLTGGLFHEHLGTIDVVALDDQRCLVTYQSDASPAVMAVVLGGATFGALVELRRQLESGAGPALDALARSAAEA